MLKAHFELVINGSHSVLYSNTTILWLVTLNLTYKNHLYNLGKTGLINKNMIFQNLK